MSRGISLPQAEVNEIGWDDRLPRVAVQRQNRLLCRRGFLLPRVAGDDRRVEILAEIESWKSEARPRESSRARGHLEKA